PRLGAAVPLDRGARERVRALLTPPAGRNRLPLVPHDAPRGRLPSRPCCPSLSAQPPGAKFRTKEGSEDPSDPRSSMRPARPPGPTVTDCETRSRDPASPAGSTPSPSRPPAHERRDLPREPSIPGPDDHVARPPPDSITP